MLRQPLHHGHGNGAAGTARHIVEDAGDLHLVRRLGEVAVHALRICLVVVRGDQQQRVSPHVLILDALFDLGGGAVGAAAHDHRHPAVHHPDGVLHHRGVLLMGHGGVLAGGAQGEDAVGPGGDLPLQQSGQRVEVDAPVRPEGGDHGDDGTLQMFELHVVCPPYFSFFTGRRPLPRPLRAAKQNKKSVETRPYRQLFPPFPAAKKRSSL